MTCMLLRSLAAGVLVLAVLPAHAQDAKPERWTLQEAVNAPGWLKLSGSIRPRYETMANQFVAGRTGDDEFFGLQSLLRAEIDTGEIILGGELLDSRRISGDAGGGTPAEVDTLEPAQLYLAWRPKDLFANGDSLDLTLGRFTMDVGSRRLVSRSNYRSIFTEFDGVRAVWKNADNLQLTGFYTAIANRAPSDVPSALNNEVAFNPAGENVRFGGVHLQGALPHGVTGELYAFDLDEDDASDAQTRNRDFVSFGARLKRAAKPATFDGEIEYISQSGTIRGSTSPADLTDLDHDADYVHVEGGYTFDAPWVPRVALQYDLASGDESPTDAFNQRFDSLFGDRSFEYGPTSIYGAIARTNLDSFAVRLEVKPDQASEAFIALRDVKLDEPRDSFANSGVRDATGASGDNVGTQVELRYRRWLAPDSVRLSVGGAALIRGDFLKTAPNATLEGDTYYGYTELTFSF
jgi:hypothetical protein